MLREKVCWNVEMSDRWSQHEACQEMVCQASQGLRQEEITGLALGPSLGLAAWRELWTAHSSRETLLLHWQAQAFKLSSLADWHKSDTLTATCPRSCQYSPLKIVKSNSKTLNCLFKLWSKRLYIVGCVCPELSQSREKINLPVIRIWAGEGRGGVA